MIETYPLTLCLNTSLSSRVNESDLAMMGTTLTTSASFFKTTISIYRCDQLVQRVRSRIGRRELTGANVCPVGLIKNTQQCIRVSGMNLSRMAVSSFLRYDECWSLICGLSAAEPKIRRQSAAHVFDNRIPTALVVDLVSVPRRVNDVQLELDTVLHDHCTIHERSTT